MTETADHQARLAAALEEIAGEPVECRMSWCETCTVAPCWHTRWSLGRHGYQTNISCPEEAIAAACRTLRAALGLPEPGAVHIECDVRADRAWVGQYHCAMHGVWFREDDLPELCPVGQGITNALDPEGQP